MKKMTAAFLSVLMALLSCTALSAGAAQEPVAVGAPSEFSARPGLYVHAVSGSQDTEAWQMWQCAHDNSLQDVNPSEKYFFLPTSADDAQVDVYNSYTGSVALNGVTIPSGETRTVSYNKNQDYHVTAGGQTYTLRYMKSNAEAAIYINNPNADGNGTDLMTYLNEDKSRSVAATGAIVTPDGSIDNTAIKKIKGRGNTTWGKSKKAYNITYSQKVSIAGMQKNKKYSILANYQDDSLSRNRILYDLSDAVGMPYASDSRIADFYVDGIYRGSYQMAEKVEAGSLVTDVTGEEYLNPDGGINADFPFVAEVDASADDTDYYVTCNNGIKITIKAPEIDPGEPGYEEVKAYVRNKFNDLLSRSVAAVQQSSLSLSDVLDLDSAAKLYLINELGKNWDSGVSSTFFTYKQDETGQYKFFGSPVWDYDNSLGNAVGVGSDLNNMGVSDYQQYTGWWCRYKGKNAGSNTSYNIINNLARNQEILNVAAQIWFNDFMPAIRHFSGEMINPAVDKELYTADTLYSLLHDSAEMNYQSGWLLNTGSWIAPHTSINMATFDFYTGVYRTIGTVHYNQNDFTDMFNYARDWMISRAAWLSSQMYGAYNGSKARFDIDRDGVFSIQDATALQRYLAEFIDLSPLQFGIADADGNNVVNIRDVTYMQRELAGLNDPETPSQGVVYLDSSGQFDQSNQDFYAWTWNTSSDGVWIKGEGPSSKVTFNGVKSNIIFTRKNPEAGAPDLSDGGNVWNQTPSLVTQYDKTYKITEWYAGTWIDGETAPQGTTKVTFVNTVNWGSTINVYFWNSSTATTSWPGERMVAAGTVDGYPAYTYYVPSDASNVIFNDGSLQTENIPFDGQPHVYRATNQLSERGRHYFTIDGQ